MWGWILTSALRTYLFPSPTLNLFGLQIDHTSGQAFALALLPPFFVITLSYRWFKKWKKTLIPLAVIECLLLWKYGYGLQNAISFDGAFLAAMIPFMPPLGMLAIFALAVKIRGATAFLIMGAQLLAYLRFTKRKIPMALGLLALAAVAWYSQGDKIFNDSERLQTWYRSIGFIYKAHGLIQGAGIGTFYWIGPTLQRFHGDLFMHMHNDWLQCLFEAGIIGLSLMVVFYCRLLWRARDSARTFIALVGVGAFGLTYYPLHFFPSALFICFLVREALESVPKSERIGCTIER